MRICPDCHAPVWETADFCDNCGYPLGSGLVGAAALSLPAEKTFVGEATAGTCSSCGYQNIPGEMFCQNCGVQLAPVTSAPPPLPKQVTREGGLSGGAMPFKGCPNCGHPMNPGDVYCENCGAQISSAVVGQRETQPKTIAPAALIEPPKPAVHLVVSSNKAVILPDMDRDDWLVGRSDPVRGIFPEVDLAIHGGDESGVSRSHARLIAQEGRRFILDLNSTNYTFLNGVKLQPGRLYPLKNGDEIRFGLLALTYYEEIAN